MSISGTRCLFSTLAAIGIVTASGLAAPAHSGAADLAWKFEKGEVLRYEFTQKNARKFETQGQDLESTSTLVLNLTWTVNEVEADGTAKITQTIERVRVDMENGSQRLSYDSKADDPAKANETNDSAETLRKFYSIATTEPYSLTINNRGEVLEAQVPPKLADLIREYQFQPLADTGGVLSSEGIKKIFVQFFPELPEKPVEPGSTWTGSLEVPAGALSLTLTTKYTLESQESQTAKISGVVDTTIKPRPGVPATLEIKSQTSSAEYAFDTGSGCLDHSSVSQTIQIEAKQGDRTSQMTLNLSINAKRMPEEK